MDQEERYLRNHINLQILDFLASFGETIGEEFGEGVWKNFTEGIEDGKDR